MNTSSSSVTREQAHKQISVLLEQIEQQIVGQENTIKEVLCAFLSGGHILMTGVPGLGKTRLIKVFAQHLGLTFSRIQYNPDLLPSDITGSEILQFQSSQERRAFEFMPGPLFAHLVLADEINRASPRTQAAMLEAMQERAVTVNGKSYPLPTPFMVCATQNPLESEGTYPLPEAQLDRFLLHSLMDYPREDAELRILENHLTFVQDPSPAATQDSQHDSTPSWSQMIQQAQSTPVSSQLYKMINTFIRATRGPLPLPANTSATSGTTSSELLYGAGPRAGLALIAAAKSWALIAGDDELRWRHVKDMAHPILRHRLCLTYTAQERFPHTDAYIDALIHGIEEQHTLFRHAQTS